ncbi:MAG: 2-succinyl-6-hydroxy-2,4-cyclohexadiene-1-carboxylate synthase [Bacteroidetes bacterium QS_8_68_15]|nr:MAG: 2-succinyl-6-hydroxy-2,4-cyclohexadiene-1-carboxylate synthase [Bacteroidetes bacterium QS_8_68_15]
MLFLHGFMGAAANWQPIAGRLTDGARCLAVDLPGHGSATGRLSDDDYTMDGAADALAATLDTQDLSRVAVVGYSMGGRLALYFALQWPERCRRLLLESASPGLETETARADRRRTDAERARRISGDFRAFLEDWYRMPLFASLSRHGLVEEAVARRLDNDPAELVRSLEGMGTGRQPSLWPRLPELAMPALVLTGALDEKYCRLTEAMAARSKGRLRRTVVEDAGHNVHAERPERFAARLRAFLGEDS